MKPLRRVPDPRAVLVLGILLLLSAALTLREVAGPGARTGGRINRALAEQEEGEPERAYATLQRVLEERPEDPDAWRRAGEALAALDRPFEAAVYFQKAADLDERSHRIRYELAKSLVRAEFPGQARQALEEVFARKSDHADGLQLAAALAASAAEVELAIELWTRAQDAGPSDRDRVRHDPLFDPVRNDLRFVEAVRSRRLPGTFVEEESSRDQRSTATSSR